MISLCFERPFWNIFCICMLTTLLVPYFDLVHRFPGRFWLVRLMIIRPYAVLRFPRPCHRAGFRLELCCDMASDAIRSLMFCDLLCSEMYGDLKPSGVMLCVAPASEWRPRSWAFAWFRLHYVYVYDLIRILTYWFVLPFIFGLLSVLAHISVLRALHTQYIFRTDPLSSGAAFHARRYRRWWSATVGPTFCCLGLLLLTRSSLLVYTPVMFLLMYIWTVWVRRGPVPSYDSVCLSV